MGVVGVTPRRLRPVGQTVVLKGYTGGWGYTLWRQEMCFGLARNRTAMPRWVSPYFSQSTD